MEMDMHSRNVTKAPPWNLLGCAQLERVPLIEFDRLLRPCQRAVILATHPFDEVLACGGLLQILSLRGHALQLISVADEACAGDTPPQGRSVAQALENSDSLRRLGIPALQMKWVRGRFPPNRLAARQDSLLDFLLRYLRPNDVVFSPWRYDGDPDREAVANAARDACEMLGTRLVEMPIQAWQWASAEDVSLPWRQSRKLVLDHPTLARKRHAINSQASGALEGLAFRSDERRRLQLHYELFIL
jgi:LmbE family N-acetylglucosaminyl deacetylase